MAQSSPRGVCVESECTVKTMPVCVLLNLSDVDFIFRLSKICLKRPY